jgi:hypothetical protein
MSPGRYDLAIYRGDSAAWRFRLWADECKSKPFDLTGCTVKAEVRAATGTEVLGTLDLAVTLPNVIDAKPNGELPSGKWDLQVTGPDFVTTVLAGAVQVRGDITDSTAVPT